jgi:hypothetical protein
MLRRPSTVVIETCVSRLSDLLPGADVPRSQWWLFSRVEVEGVPEHLPGHPTAHELAARLSKPDTLVPVDSLSADLRTLLRSGIAADVTVEMIRPRFHGITESKLEVVGHASALRFVVKPRQIEPFEDYVVAFAPELGTYDAAYSSTHQDTGPERPHVPWLPAFHQAFAELRADWESTHGEPNPLHLCCLVRHAICVAGGSHMPPVKPLALRFERDEEAAPGLLIIALDVPADELLSRLRDLPQTTSSMDMWRLACEDALATDDDLGQDPGARKALAVPNPHPRRRKLRQQQRTRYRLLDCLLGHAALLPLNVLASLAARRLGVSPGDDMRAALSAAALHGVRHIVFADRSINLTVRRVGTAVRKAFTKAVPAVTGGLAVVCFMFKRMTGIATGAGVLAVAAIACFCGALAVLVIAPSALVARIMTPSPREATQRLRASQFQALLDERDTNLAGQLRCLALTGMPPAHASQLVLTQHECGGGVYALSTGRQSDDAHADLPPGADGGCIVAVVGAAHVPGILSKWRAYDMTVDCDG